MGRGESKDVPRSQNSEGSDWKLVGGCGDSHPATSSRLKNEASPPSCSHSTYYITLRYSHVPSPYQTGQCLVLPIPPATQLGTQVVTEPIQTSKCYRNLMLEGIVMSRKEKNFILDSFPIGEATLDTRR